MVENLGVEMMKIYFDHIFLLGLYAYLRQIELSIDRVLHDSWEKLKPYFDERISPEKVIAYLEAQAINKKRK